MNCLSQMPINQAHELCGAYDRAGIPVQFELMRSGAAFYDAERLAIVKGIFTPQLSRARLGKNIGNNPVVRR